MVLTLIKNCYGNYIFIFTSVKILLFDTDHVAQMFMSAMQKCYFIYLFCDALLLRVCVQCLWWLSFRRDGCYCWQAVCTMYVFVLLIQILSCMIMPLILTETIAALPANNGKSKDASLLSVVEMYATHIEFLFNQTIYCCQYRLTLVTFRVSEA